MARRRRPQRVADRRQALHARRSRRSARRGWTGRCRSRSRSARRRRETASRKLGPVAGRRSRPRQRGGGLGDEHVGEHVGQVRDGGQDPVVGLGVDRRRARAEPAQEAVQALVEHSRGVDARASGTRSRRRTGRRARARRPRSRRRRADGRRRSAGRRWAATIARLVEPTSVTTQSSRRPRAPRRRARDSAPTGAATNTACGAGDGVGDRRRRARSMTPPRQRASQRRGRPVIAGDRRHRAARRAASATEPPISPTPRTASRMPARAQPARAAGADGARPACRAPRRWCPSRCSRR